ncbi:hypothetical protein BgiMline_022285 [Biomphalaria glabrata]|nr:hypothetical protein BgiMline_010164 [Biomphalaria glabrata]
MHFDLNIQLNIRPDHLLNKHSTKPPSQETFDQRPPSQQTFDQRPPSQQTFDHLLNKHSTRDHILNNVPLPFITILTLTVDTCSYREVSFMCWFYTTLITKWTLQENAVYILCRNTELFFE